MFPNHHEPPPGRHKLTKVLNFRIRQPDAGSSSQVHPNGRELHHLRHIAQLRNDGHLTARPSVERSRHVLPLRITVTSPTCTSLRHQKRRRESRFNGKAELKDGREYEDLWAGHRSLRRLGL